MNTTHPGALRASTQRPSVGRKILGGIFCLALTLCLPWPGRISASARAAATAECPASIGYGETVHCAIASAAEEDRYTFSANAGDVVLARMSKTSGDFYPQVAVEDAGGAGLCDQLSVTSAEISSCALPASGTYTLVASNGLLGDHTGSYYLYLQRLNGPGNPTALGFGQTLAGSIDTPAEMDSYTFNANAGDVILARMSKASEAEELYAKIRLYGPDGSKLEEQNSVTSAEITECTLPSSGTYTLLASDGLDGVHSGAYYLYLQRLNAPGNVTAIGFGQTLAGSIGTPAEMDSYTFSANAGDVLLARMSKASSSEALYTKIRLYGPDGSELEEQNSVTSAEIAGYTLPGSGVYTLLASDGYNGTRSGGYYLYMQRLNAPGNATAISLGQTRSGSMDTPAEMDSYTFSGSLGDVVQVRMSKSSGTLWPKVRLYGPDGGKLAEDLGSSVAEIGPYTLAADGTYTLLASDGFNGTYTGNYSLWLKDPNDAGGGAVYLPLIVNRP